MTPAGATGLVEHNGGRIVFQTAGTGDALVFIHGFALDRRVWLRQMERFRSRYRVVAYDCRGFGRSSIPTGSYSHADDLRGLLDHLKIAKAHLVGLSMGGRIAVNFAIARPEQVSSLVLIDSDVGGYRFSFDWDPEGGTLEAMRAAWLAHDVFDGIRGTPALLRSVEAMVADYTCFHWRGEDPREPDWDAISLLHRVTARTSVIVGEDDLPDFHMIARLLADRIPKADLTTVSAAGHLLPVESPERCTRLIARHLSDSDISGRSTEPGSR